MVDVLDLVSLWLNSRNRFLPFYYIIDRIEDVIDAIAKIHLTVKPEIIAVKLGENDCFIFNEGKIRFRGLKLRLLMLTLVMHLTVPFIVGLLENQPIEKVGKFANAVGALTTTGFGAIVPIPKEEGLRSFWRNRFSSSFSS